MVEASEKRRASFDVGDVVDGRYTLRRDLGRGAAGRVFEAVHDFTGRSVALKLVASDAAPNLRAELYVRLAREARALAAVRHPGVVSVLDGGFLKDGTPFLVMEMLEGRTLEGLIAGRGRVAVEDAVSLGLQLAAALEAVHAAGVLHRDVKPSNVVIVEDHAHTETAKIVDFGVARLHDDKGDKLTSIGALVGTPSYMAPEQLLGLDELEARCDVYALGVTLFECLTGRVPYEGNYAQVILQVCSPKPAVAVECDGADIPTAVAEVVHRAMAKERADRFATMADFGRAIRSSLPASRLRSATQFLGAVQGQAGPRGAGEQRRKLPRAPYVTPVRLIVGDVTIDARTEDISTGGVMLICRHPCPADRGGTLRFALPMDGSMVTLAVHVRWVRAARADDPSGPRALGVEFVEPADELVASIRRYVSLMTLPEEAARGGVTHP